MTEPTDATADADAGNTAGETSNYTPPATQADLDRIIADRVARTKSQFKDYTDLKAKAAKLDQLEQANQSEAERQAAELTRWQTEAEQWRGAAVGNRIQALAANDFADPSDAVAALSGQQFLDAGGQIDETAITAALADVLERKPHWRRADPSQQGPRPPAPNPNQGNSGAAANDPAALFGSIVRSQIGGG